MEKTHIKDNELNSFLRDFEQNCEIEVLEEAKGKKEIIEIAKAKGILLKDNIDLAGFKTIYTFPDEANANKVRVPKKELLKKMPTIIGKAVDIDHIRRYTIGYYIDYRYKEKENQIIAYGIFFKSIFKNEWKEAQKLFKAKKLTTSYEIWSPKSSRIYLDDGTYELHDFQLAGGALIFREEPAFEDAKVLELAKRNIDNLGEEQADLIYACINKEELCICPNEKELITATTSSVNIEKPDKIDVVSESVSNNQKITCSNCGQNFEKQFVAGQLNEIKCPNCFSILDQTGKMIYPPQIIDFSLSCPNCQARNNWLTLSRNENKATIKCLACAKEYDIQFKKDKEVLEYIQKLMFLRTGKVRCLQCGTYNEFSVPSNTKVIEITCEKCGLNFSFDVSHKKVREIKNITKRDKVDKNISKEKNVVEKATYILDEAKLEFTEDEVIELDKDYEGYQLEESQEKFNCECLKCGFKLQTDKHCNTIKCPKCGGDMRRAERPGKGQPIEKSKLMSYQERQKLPDSSFAVIITVKDKKTGKPRKIRKYPINDKAHVRNALARLGQPKAQATLKKLGISIESVKKKVLKRAKELKMTELLKRRKIMKSNIRKLLRKAVSKIKISKKEVELSKANVDASKAKVEKFTKGIKKFAHKISDLRSKVKGYELEVASLEKEVNSTKNFYIENAKKVYERRTQLGKYGEDLKDEEIVDDDKFELAVSKKKVAELEKPKLETASTKAGDKITDSDTHKKQREEVKREADRLLNI